MNKIKRFFSTSGVYLVGNVLSKLVGFFLLPIYTYALAPDQFGTFDVAVTVISLSVPIAFFQVWDGMFRYAFEKNKQEEKYGIISSSFSVWAAGLLLYSSVFFIICRVLQFNHQWLIYFYGLSISIQYQYAYIARSFLKNKLFVISGLINCILSALINIILILVFNAGIESLYIAPVLGCAAQALVIEAVLHPLKSFRIRSIDVKKIKEMLRFSLPLCLATILYWFLSGYTKLAISQKLGADLNGLYAVANRFSSLMTFLITVFQYAWNETAYLMASDDKRFSKYEKSVEYVFKVIMSGCAIFMLFSKLIFPYFIDPSYREALFIIPLSFTGVSINAFSSFIDTIFMAEKQTSSILKATLIGACVNVAAFRIITPVWGLMGAVGALNLAYTVLALFRLIALGKIFSVKFRLSNILYLLIPAIVICVYYAGSKLWLILSIPIVGGISVWGLREILIPLWRAVIKKYRHITTL